MTRTYFLPWPISTNAIWRSVNGRTILSEKARDWFDEAAEELMVQRPKRVDGPVKIGIELLAPNKRKWDLDNKTKALFDALVKSKIIKDDNYKIVKAYSVGQITEAERGPGAYVTVTPWGRT